MRSAKAVLDIHQKRGANGLPLERVYKHLFNPEFYLQAYGKLYRNEGAMTKGVTKETVDGMDLQRIHNIIGFLKMERREWTPVRRVMIPKANGKSRPLGIPTFSDKLVQEVMRTLLEPYYEQKFSKHSHGFRPGRGCHTALLEIQGVWKGTAWFIEGDIKGCFDNIDHEILLGIIRRDIHDGRFLALIDGLLKAGYMEDWKRYDTFSGTPQGGIISPLLANIYMNELDRFVEDTLIPAYTKGKLRGRNKEYMRIDKMIVAARRREDFDEVERLELERRKHPSNDNFDPDYRRLRYIRYADDFLLGFAGPKKEAEEIRDRLSEYLEKTLKLSLSKEKTLVTHAADEKAKFLGYEIKVARRQDCLSEDGGRRTNGRIALLMPRKVIQKVMDGHSRKGKVTHRNDLIDDQDHTILQRYQGVLVGTYNYYCMAVNVSGRMNHIKWILERSLTRTLALKYGCKVSGIYRKYRAEMEDRKVLRVVTERPGKKALVATFGGVPFVRKPKGSGAVDFVLEKAWHNPGGKRSEAVQRLLADRCELCEGPGPLQAHHVHKLADIDRPGRTPKANWEKVMAARRRKTLMVCKGCHDGIHAGTHDGPKL